MAEGTLPKLAALDHVNIESTDIEASARFYADVKILDLLLDKIADFSCSKCHVFKTSFGS